MDNSDAGVTRLEDLPIDLAGEIFGHLTSPSDLLHVAQASKSLFRIAIRLLYRDICYDSPAHLYHNLSFWERKDLGLENVAEAPRSVVIGRKLGQGLVPDSHEIPQARIGFGLDVYGNQINETFPPAFQDLSRLLLSLTNLQSISFQYARFPFELYTFLGELPPGICSLSFEQCTFVSASVVPSMLAPAMLTHLPITELNLTGSSVQGRFSLSHLEHVLTPSMMQSAFLSREMRVQLDMFQILTRSPNLRALCLDWNHANATRFSRDSDLPTAAFANLHYLELRSWNQSDAAWNSESNSPESKALLKSAMYKLLAPCTELTELVLFGYMPGVTPASSPLLPALKSYTGPVDFLRSTLRGCENLEKIVFPTSIKDVDALMSDTLPYTASTTVRYFDVTLEKWDIEIMYAVIAELPGLEQLRIKYEKDYPDEDMLISFGPEFLSRLPNIRVLHIYRPDEDYNFNIQVYGLHAWMSRFASPPRRLHRFSQRQRSPLALGRASYTRRPVGLEHVVPSNAVINMGASTSAGGGDTLHLRSCPCYLRPNLRSRIRASLPIVDVGPSGLPDAHEYMASWQKYAPGLREVRLVDAFVWRRAGVGDVWCRRDLKESVEDEEEESRDDDGSDGRCTCRGSGSIRSFMLPRRAPVPPNLGVFPFGDDGDGEDEFAMGALDDFDDLDLN
ncbi:hypothetical protein GYMLUDRAFT_100658 [Collybiopsis luxurians FD-317 M1]|uniref:F-box domain-containing protein n=1 Tax=Collybiopsis luxurians FD-317 M1 TaxID=944289 RepID=A0A0D0AQS4_9AGAR|nr:hypothetical protein GYMLUDRAFT_100658 [Collybiopsis luxurians FD-317 M1]